MASLKFTGYIRLISNHPSPEWSTFPGKETQLVHYTDTLALTNRQLLKFSNRQYLILLDGIIYEFDNQAFSEDHFPQVLDYLSRDPEDTLRRLNGEFVLIFVDLPTDTIWICTSESGNAACFYRKREGEIHFSNSLAEMAGTLDSNKQVNFQRIFDILTGNNLGSHHTCFTEIKRLMPGQYMKVDAGKILIGKYSKLFSEPPERESLADPYEQFRELFGQAVRRRTEGNNLGIALSSGKDSTAVAAMASKVKYRAAQNLTGYTYYPTQLQEELLSDKKYNETLLLDDFFERYPEVRSKHVVPKEEVVIRSLEKSIEIYGEPVYGASNQFWIQEMHQMMIRDQCDTMLTGQGGNYTISWPPPELTSPGPGLVRSLARKLYPSSKRSKVPPYLSRDFLQSIQQDHFINRKRMRTMGQTQALLMENSIAYSGYLQKQVSLYHGFHVSDPTVDKDIIEYCLSLPYDIYHNQNGSRRLITHGLKDMLPKEIRENQVRSVQSADIQNRMEQEKELILEKLRFLNENNLVTFVIDIGGLAKDCESMDFATMNRKELNHLIRIILVGIFLSKI
jgi:asparagine synthase (glutamine-hydrolysing)